MLFHKQNKIINKLNLRINNNITNETDKFNFLELHINSCLTWDSHIKKVSTKIIRTTGIIKKLQIRPYLDKVTLRNLYFTFVYPYLIYCVEVWENACDTHLDPIIKIQKKCVRVITFSHYLEPTESLFKDLKILAFKKLVIQRILLLMFKHNIGIVPKAIASLFTKKK